MTRNALLTTVAALALLAQSGRDLAAQTGGGSPTVIYEWNKLLQDTIPGGGGAGAPRFYALTHIAMFDAINAVAREFTSYRVQFNQPVNVVPSVHGQRNLVLFVPISTQSNAG
jgi:hypothetical protein